MVGVYLQGRMGNQLFQYAFIYSTAKKLNVKFYVDKRDWEFSLNQYFNIEPDFCSPLDNYVFNIKFLGHRFKRKFYKRLIAVFKLKRVFIDSAQSVESQLATVQNHAYYEGFFQSEKYFFAYKSYILKLFTVKTPFVNQFKNLLLQLRIPPNYIAVHIRKGDYIQLNWELGPAYFHAAIASIHRPENYYVFMSDEPEKIGDEFNYIQNKYISAQPEIIDFQFLNNAAACIISNSTFSWWGAYLNPNHPEVIAPKYWVGFNKGVEFPADIIPEKFTTIDAYPQTAN